MKDELEVDNRKLSSKEQETLRLRTILVLRSAIGYIQLNINILYNQRKAMLCAIRRLACRSHFIPRRAISPCLAHFFPSTRKRRFLLILFCILSLGGAFGGSVHAADDLLIKTPGGQDIFRLRLFNTGETYFPLWGSEDSPEISGWTLNEGERSALRNGSEYLAHILANDLVENPLSPVLITVGTLSGYENADADSELYEDGWTMLGAAITGNWTDTYPKPEDGGLALVHFGDFNSSNPHDAYYTGPLRSLPDNGDPIYLAAVTAHELGHALGILSYAEKTESGEYRFGNVGEFWKFSGHLVAQDGMTMAKPNMLIAQQDYSNSAVFGVEDDKALFFSGKHVTEVLGGAAPQILARDGEFQTAPNLIPINGWEDDSPEFQHIELTRSMMSHQIYRNWGVFMEAELAILQDIGYAKIDRGQFFGHSLYHSGKSDYQIGGAWKSGAPSAIGAHIYGHNNTVTFRGDYEASGFDGIGIRLESDGMGEDANVRGNPGFSGNTLTIASGARVAATGELGTGLLVSYGNGHKITLEPGARIEATGAGGIGVAFDFGDNIVGNQSEYRGSYIRARNNLPLDFAQTSGGYNDTTFELAGPLVESFDVSGGISGRAAAIYISPNAYVRDINIHDGAWISGDIVSRWTPSKTYSVSGVTHTLSNLFTTLRFDGNAALNGDILWESDEPGAVNSLDIRQEDGHLRYNGLANVHSWEINSGASLGGNSSIRIDGADPFLNAGRIAPGNSIGTIIIAGAYTQSASGSLLMEFTPSETDRFIVTGTSTIIPGASLVLQALPAFYATGSARELTDSELFGTGSVRMADYGSGLALSPLASPTLLTWWSRSGTNPVFNVTRASEAYSQWSAGGTGKSVGKALYALSGRATGDMRNLFTAVDFSNPDGSTVRSALRQLAPTAYENATWSSLLMGDKLSGLLFNHPSMTNGAPLPDTVTGIALPFGGYIGQGGRGDNYGYDTTYAGVMGVLNRGFEKGSAGLHVAVYHAETDNRSGASTNSQANGISFGVHGSLRPQERVFINGLAAAGLENVDMDRTVEIEQYRRKTDSSYTAATARISLRAGYEWQAGNFHFGPLVGLDYGLHHRPSVSENGGGATRLKLDAATVQSLRTTVGAQAKVDTRLSGALHLQAGLGAGWIHELLPHHSGGKATFAGQDGGSFSVKDPAGSRDAFALNGSVSLITHSDLSVTAYVDTEWRSTGVSVLGGLSVGWKF